jgi:hypothetical protein
MAYWKKNIQICYNIIMLVIVTVWGITPCTIPRLRSTLYYLLATAHQMLSIFVTYPSYLDSVSAKFIVRIYHKSVIRAKLNMDSFSTFNFKYVFIQFIFLLLQYRNLCPCVEIRQWEHEEKLVLMDNAMCHRKHSCHFQISSSVIMLCSCFNNGLPLCPQLCFKKQCVHIHV